MNDRATARPWRISREYHMHHIVDGTGTVLQVSGVSMPSGYVPADHLSYANAELIVRAVNSHDALVLAMKQARGVLQIIEREAPGYDWNADPLYLTRITGDFYAVIDEALKLAGAAE